MRADQIHRLERFCGEQDLDPQLIDAKLTYQENLNLLKRRTGGNLPPIPRAKPLVIIPNLIKLLEEGGGKVCTYRSRPLKSGDVYGVFCSRFPRRRCERCRRGRPHLHVTVDRVEQIELGALNDEDAWLAGVGSVEELKALLEGWYPNRTRLYRNWFSVLTPPRI